MAVVVGTDSAQALTFRLMQPADLDQVYANEVRAYAFPWTRGILEDCLKSYYECWVLEQDGQIIGHGVLSCMAREAHLLNVCIAPSQQGQGHGRAFVEHLLDRAKSQADMLFLEVRPSNTPALALYQALGFNEVGRRPGYYPALRGREDALVLAMQWNMDWSAAAPGTSHGADSRD